MALDGGRFTETTSRAASALLAVQRTWRAVQSTWWGTLGLVAERAPPVPGWLTRFVAACGRDGPVRKSLVVWFNRQPLVRFISRSLLRRIVVSNLLGFIILLAGIIYLSFNSSWLINTKREALRVQGEIIAAAISGEARVVRGRIVVDPDRLPAGDDALIPFRDDNFTALELSIKPEVVGPMIKRLTRPTNTRARIYDRTGNLVVDSDTLFSRGQIAAPAGTTPSATAPTPGGPTASEDDDNAAASAEPAAEEKPKTKNFWTRLRYWLIDRELQVYRDIGSANGQYYPEVKDALKGSHTAMLMLDEKGLQIVSAAVPIKRSNVVQGVLLLSTRPGEIDEAQAEAFEAIWPLAALALMASLLTSYLLHRTVAEPVKRLSEAAEHVSRDINAYTQLPDYADRKDEVGQMSQAFNAMTASLYRRIEASERFAADVAHELKNPLTAASSTAQSLGYAKTDADRDMLVQQIQNELKRLNRLITDVSSASRLDAELARQQQEPVDLGHVLRSVISIFTDKAETKGVTLTLATAAAIEGRDDYIVSGNESRIGQVFTNLVDNALSFSKPGARVAIAARSDASDVIVTVEDEGPGIAEDKLGKIFERFYTYRPTAEASRGNNSGLGLSISREIVEAHGGRVWAENRYATAVGAGQGGADQDHKSQAGATPLGARFTVSLPRLRVATRGGPSVSRRA
ncbi:MAG: stimulus-sensing domain-containing protein [Hyphomicrobiaceae bacterium]|nr:stimulus-sensing domain-containing protein [Hyphomicrobiaceae bacterium]